MRVRVMVAVAAVGVLVLAGCSSSAELAADTPVASESAVVESSAAPEPVDEPSEDPVETEDPVEAEEPSPSPSSEFSELAFGDALPVIAKDGSESTSVALGKPKLAKCQYASIGCAKPEIGSRVVSVPITIENTGDATATWSAAHFLLEFPDGTQVEANDGAALEYAPDNAMGYEQKIRPGGKYKSVLVFEAPKGPFTVLVLTSVFDGEPFAAWS